MEFASTHVLNYDESDEEIIDDDYKEGAFAAYQGLVANRGLGMINNALYGGVEPISITGTSASDDYDNPGFRGQLKGPTPAPRSDRTYDNAIFQKKTDGTGPESTVYDNAVFSTPAGGSKPEDKDDIPQIPNEHYLPLINQDKPSIYDNPSWPQEEKKKKKIGVPWRTKKPQTQQAVYAEVPQEYMGPPPEPNDSPRPPPLPPGRTPSQVEAVDSDDDTYDYVALATNNNACKKPKPAPRKIRRADTNIVAVKFDALTRPSQMQEGRRVICDRCSAMLSHLSNVKEDERGKVWRCEYCDLENIVDIPATHFPTQGDMTYVLSPGSDSGDDTAIIFCLDISGSMAVTTEVPYSPDDSATRQNNESAALNMYHQEVSSTDPSAATQQPNRVVSHVSRLQLMQSAIDEQLNHLGHINPSKRVGIVTFNDMVTIIGDGTSDPIPLEGAGLTDFQSVTGFGTAMPLPMPISEVKRHLADKVFSLSEGGQTALGPALLISVAMASQKAGSKVVICTDGLANVGMGLMQQVDDETYQESVRFFEDVGVYARNAGVCVSVLTMEGEDCRVIELGNVADKTGGRVTVVDPLKLNETIADIVQDSILATNVSAKMVLHRGLYFRDQNHQETCSINREVGNVRADTEATFEFGVRRKRFKEVLYDNSGGMTVLQEEPVEEDDYDVVGGSLKSMISGFEELPFQVQITYTGRDGGLYARVITMKRPVTKSRQFAEQNANVAIVGAHAAQNAAKLAVEGNFGEAQMNALVTQKLVERHAGQRGDGEEIYGAYIASVAPMQHEINQAQKRELLHNGGNLSDISEGEGSETEAMNPSSRSPQKTATKKNQRRKNISDRTASLFYRMKAATSRNFAAAT